MATTALVNHPLRLTRVIAGRPVASGGTRKLGVTTGAVRRKDPFPDYYSEIEVIWANGTSEWAQISWLKDFDAYLAAMEKEAGDLHAKRQVLANKLAGRANLTPR